MSSALTILEKSLLFFMCSSSSFIEEGNIVETLHRSNFPAKISLSETLTWFIKKYAAIA